MPIDVRSSPHGWLFKVLLGVFGGSIVFSLGGMTLLRYVPSSAAQAGALLPWLMKVPTWAYMVTLPALVFVLYLPRIGWRRSVLAVIWGSFVGMMAELIGTGTGLPFGEYAYTAFLNPKIMGEVPWFIPPSWYAVSMVSLDLAGRLGLTKGSRLGAAALFMVLWDVGLDPAMGAGFPIWEWRVEGFYYSMPAINWVGWFLTSLLIAWGYEDLADISFDSSNSWTVAVWLLNGLLPVGICLIAGLGAAALAGGVALLIPVLATWDRHSSSPEPGPG